MFEQFGINAGYVEDLHARYRENPQAVGPEWRAIFEQGMAPPPFATKGVNGTRAASPRTFPASTSEALLATGVMQGRVYQLLNAYRVRGHMFAHIDPLGTPPEAAPEIDLSTFGLRESDLDTIFPAVGIGGLGEKARLRDIVEHLRETYCRSIGVEFTQLEQPEARTWLQERM